MTKRGNGEGTVRKRPSGKWEARYYGSDGRQHSITMPTQSAAIAALRAAHEASAAQLPPPDHTLTVSGWLDEWLDTSVRPRLKPRTVASYENTCDLYIRPAIGRIQLSRLGPRDIARMLASLTARGDLSPTTVRYAFVILKIALARAVKTGRVARNVALLVDAPAKARHELRPLTLEEIGAFQAAIAGHKFEALFLMAIGTGAREGEILGLTWENVDLDAGTFTVRHTLDRTSRTLAEPKTERSRRDLTLPLPVTAALRRHRSRQDAERATARIWGNKGFVFASAVGGPIDAGRVTRALHTVLDKAGIRQQRFHDLRHAYATLQLEAGADLFQVSRALGHANIGTTSDIYGHFTQAMSQEMADRMTGILEASDDRRKMRELPPAYVATVAS
jgi:integrase